jgi:hypothetical protein
MYELSGKIKELNIDFLTDKALLVLSVNQKQTAINCYDELHSKEKLSFKIGRYTESRTNDANRYFWALCEKLAEKLNTTKIDIYLNSIREVGVFYDDEIEAEKVQRRRKAWEMIGTGWLTERVDFSADGNKEVIRFYYGSSSYNKKQMSRLIDNVIQDCKAEGIETRTPEQIANLINLWEAGK